MTALRSEGNSTVRYVRNPPIVPVRENYDRLGYDSRDVTRDRRYTRYLSPTVMLRSHTGAELPRALEDYAGGTSVDELIVAPGLVYRRDAVDRSHVGEPHQVDLWRIRSVSDTEDGDMLRMIGGLVEAVLPGAEWKVTDAEHPYTAGGRRIDVLHEGTRLPLTELSLRAITRLEVIRPLRLVSYRSAGLGRFGLHPRDLTDTLADEYPRTVTWAEAAWEYGADGVAYLCRHFNGKTAYCLFGADHSKTLKAQQGWPPRRHPTLLQWDRDWLVEVAAQVGVHIDITSWR